MKKWSVYLITCLPTGMQYIGCTSASVRDRFNFHVYESKRKIKNNPIYADIRLLGPQAFQVSLLSTHDSKDSGLLAEVECMHQFNTIWPQGYNLSQNTKSHAVTRALLSFRHTGKEGTPHTEETKARMREGRSEEQLRSLDRLHDGNVGRKATPEHAEKIRQKQLKAWETRSRKQSPEYVAKRMAGMALARAKRKEEEINHGA